MAYRIVGYHDATGYRTVMPIEWPTREEAEKVMKVTQALVPLDFRLVIETADDEPSVH